MSVKSVVLALMLASGVAAAADTRHVKPLKAAKPAVHSLKAVNHAKESKKGTVRKGIKVPKHQARTPKAPKYKGPNYKKHKA